jgi:AcrR family transcriptional regulator
MTAAQEWTTSYPGRPARTAMREPRAADCFAERSIARARARSHAEVAGLLEAAWRVLERGGWWGLKVDSVLREAQLSTRCFHRHFSSKNELLLALMEDEVRRAMERMERTIARQEDPASQVQAWVEAVIGFAHSDRTAPRTRMFVAHWGEIESEFPQEVARCLRNFLRPLVEIIRRGCDQGVFLEADPEMTALAIYHLSSGAARDAHGAGWPSFERERHVVTTFALRGLMTSVAAIPG